LKDGGMSMSDQNWTQEMMAEKFRWLGATVLEAAKVDEILDMAWHLDEIDSIRELTEKLK